MKRTRDWGGKNEKKRNDEGNHMGKARKHPPVMEARRGIKKGGGKSKDWFGGGGGTASGKFQPDWKKGGLEQMDQTRKSHSS